jgi:hypothetical protein
MTNFIMGIGVLGTWAIAALAIWGEQIRSRWVRPELRIEREGFSGTVATHENGKKARYYFIRVKNPARIPPAHEVQLVLTRIEKSGQFEPETLFDEIMPVAWARQELSPLLTRTVGSDQLANIFFVQADGILGFTPAMLPSRIPSHFPYLHQGPATLWVTLRAVSIEADSRSIRLKIEWSGQWYPSKAEIENACKVSVDSDAR